MHSKMWHILLVLSSVKDIIRYYEGKADEETFIVNRLFTKNFEHLEITNLVASTIDNIRDAELMRSKPDKVLAYMYGYLETYFTLLFHQELDNGIPQDVKDLKLDDYDESLNNVKKTFDTLTT